MRHLDPCFETKKFEMPAFGSTAREGASWRDLNAARLEERGDPFARLGVSGGGKVG
jgi:hypothetical protein